MQAPTYPSLKNKYQFESISSAARIFALLRTLKDQPHAVKLRFDTDLDSCACTLVDAHGTEGYLVFAELDKLSAYERFQTASNIHFSGEINGAEFYFKSRLLLYSGAKEARQFKIKLPVSLQYWQRRAAHRVHVSMALDVKAALNDGAGKCFVGQIRDISAGGMRVHFVKSDAQQIDSSVQLTDCTITLHDNTDLQCRFEMRHLKQNERNKACTIGGQFSDLDYKQARAIRRFIATLERKSLRGFSA